VEGEFRLFHGGDVFAHDQHNRSLLVVQHSLGGFSHPDDAAILPNLAKLPTSGPAHFGKAGGKVPAYVVLIVGVENVQHGRSE